MTTWLLRVGAGAGGVVGSEILTPGRWAEPLYVIGGTARGLLDGARERDVLSSVGPSTT